MPGYLKLSNEYERTIVVGDIHGCMAELQELLGAVGFSDRDVLVHVGDMIDRGPASWDVAAFFRETANAFSAVGNHERRVAGAVRGTSLPAWSQIQTLSQIEEDVWLSWAEDFDGLPAVIETEHAIVTHARIEPGLNLDSQDSYFTSAVGGRSVVIERDDAGVPLWFHQTAFEKPVCIGHIGYDRNELVSGRLYALDDHCAHGGRLTAVVLPEQRLISVPARCNYYEQARTQWSQQKKFSSEKLSEWSLLLEVPRGGPGGWPLRKVARLLEAPDQINNELLGASISQLRSTIEEMGFADAIEEARRNLLNRFGHLPAEGKERGVVFQRVKSQFREREVVSLVTGLLSGECTSPVSLVNALKNKGTLADARQLLEELTADGK